MVTKGSKGESYSTRPKMRVKDNFSHPLESHVTYIFGARSSSFGKLHS